MAAKGKNLYDPSTVLVRVLARPLSLTSGEGADGDDWREPPVRQAGSVRLAGLDHGVRAAVWFIWIFVMMVLLFVEGATGLGRIDGDIIGKSFPYVVGGCVFMGLWHGCHALLPLVAVPFPRLKSSGAFLRFVRPGWKDAVPVALFAFAAVLIHRSL